MRDEDIHDRAVKLVLRRRVWTSIRFRWVSLLTTGPGTGFSRLPPVFLVII